MQRLVSFGQYTFPLTGQEKSRVVKLSGDRKKIPMNYGEFLANPSTVGAREIEIVAAVGSGLQGASGLISTDLDLEDERSFLAGLQELGRQQLAVRADRYCNAYLSEFQHNFEQDAFAWRVANWTLKFVADDPRYYSTEIHTVNEGPFTDTAVHAVPISHAGTTKAWPTITITGACAAPTIFISQGSSIPTSVPTSSCIAVTFNSLTMLAGDTLTVKTDPRPENRNLCAVYTAAADGSQVNALRFTQIPSYANSLNYGSWFPYIESPQNMSTLQWFGVSVGTAGSYSVALTYQDTWM